MWEAWTRPEQLRQWWGAEKTTTPECEQGTSTIEHYNELELSDAGDETVVNLRITINEIGSGLKAKAAAFGMKWGYKSQLDKLGALLAE